MLATLTRKEKAMSTPLTDDRDYTLDVPLGVPRERVFDALTTLDGLAGWWTPIVSGTPTPGGEIEFGFTGLDEKILMRVDDATPPAMVVWTCLTHTGHPEWQGTRLVFEIVQHDPGGGLLKFRHIGLTPDLNCYATCESGWDHFIASLLSYAAHHQGTPF
jgi:uncharacterized protein YndB with AHSA1/START domain